MTSLSVQVIGECMVEVARGAGTSARIDYAGDTYNAAIYLHRVAAALGTPLDVRYFSGVGDDQESRRMRACWLEQGIVDDAVVVPGSGPGLYLISTDEQGERSFVYWRNDSAAARLFRGTDWIQHVAGDRIYLSGISLQLMSAPSRDALRARMRDLRAVGTRVAFDSNFRPSGWNSTSYARAAMDKFLGVTDIALVTLDDEIALGGCHDVQSCAQRLLDLGVPEFVVKNGPDGAWVYDGTDLVHVATDPVAAVDTTAAGDSFNGGYLAARTAGLDPVAAAGLGNALAGRVVGVPGAILPLTEMPPMLVR